MTSPFVNHDITFSAKELFMFEVFNINQLLITNDYNKIYGPNAECIKRLTQLFVHFLGEQIKTKDDTQIKNARLFIKYIYNCYIFYIIGNGSPEFNYIDNDILQKAIVNITKILDYIDAIDKHETINVNDIIEGYFYNKNLEQITNFSLQTIEMSDEENSNSNLEETLSNDEDEFEEEPLIEEDDTYEEQNSVVDIDAPEPIELETNN